MATQLWIATGNQGKLNEFKMLLNKLPLDIHSQKELPTFYPRPETGKTFLENAQIKTRSLAAVQNTFWVLGEDSGLEVKGMNGLPGIHSARYAGEKAADSENVAKLLKMMQLKAVQDRSAQFYCSMVLISPTREEFVFEGVFKGTIAKAPKGNQGFGYDTVFIPEGETQTLAELGLAYKNQHSHRARACAQVAEILQSRCD